MAEIETERLRLRQWRDDDLDAWAEMGRDPEVMHHFPALLGRDAAAAGMERARAGIERDGYGFWAVEVKGVAPFIGFCGIKAVPADMPFAPAIEVGWRLARTHWGRGYATEGGRASLEHGWRELGLAEIVAFLLPDNRASAAVCERLGMSRDPADDFDHPAFTPETRSVGGLPQQRHALYRIRR